MSGIGGAIDLSGSGTLKNILNFFCFTPRLVLRYGAILIKVMASVAKWLRQWFVVPPFVGSIPIIRPFDFIVQTSLRIQPAEAGFFCVDAVSNRRIFLTGLLNRCAVHYKFNRCAVHTLQTTNLYSNPKSLR